MMPLTRRAAPLHLVLLVLLVLLMLGLTACGGSQAAGPRSSVHTPPRLPPSLQGTQHPDAQRVREEISRIEALQRVGPAEGSDNPPSLSVGPNEPTSQTEDADPRPARPATQRCGTVCASADGVCESEARICQISVRHPGDPAFEDACAWALDACKDARQQCTRCR